jgi:hypothetical protein
MKVEMRLALLGTALAFGTITMSNARGQMPAERAHDTDSIAVFWAKFKGAAIKGDKETVAALSRFPIARGYGMGSLKNRAQLLRRFRELFFTETDAAKCFPKATPYVEKTRSREFSISCPFARDGGEEEPFVYTFTRTRTGWKFTSFENVNE